MGKIPVSNLVKEFIFDIIQQEKMDSLQMRKIDHHIQSERFMDLLTQQVLGNQSLITEMTANLMSHMIGIDEEGWLSQRLQEQFIEATFQSSFPTAKLETVVTTLPTRLKSKTESE